MAIPDTFVEENIKTPGGEETADEPLFITLTVGDDGNYALSTNMGDGWQVHILRIAKKIREDLL